MLSANLVSTVTFVILRAATVWVYLAIKPQDIVKVAVSTNGTVRGVGNDASMPIAKLVISLLAPVPHANLLFTGLHATRLVAVSVLLVPTEESDVIEPPDIAARLNVLTVIILKTVRSHVMKSAGRISITIDHATY